MRFPTETHAFKQHPLSMDSQAGHGNRAHGCLAVEPSTGPEQKSPGRTSFAVRAHEGVELPAALLKQLEGLQMQLEGAHAQHMHALREMFPLVCAERVDGDTQFVAEAPGMPEDRELSEVNSSSPAVADLRGVELCLAEAEAAAAATVGSGVEEKRFTVSLPAGEEADDEEDRSSDFAMWKDQTLAQMKARTTLQDADLSQMVASTRTLEGSEAGRGISQRIKLLVDSNAFDLFSGSLVIMNAIFLAYETNYNLVSTPGDPFPVWMTAVGKGFTVVFLAELLLRMSAGVRHFFGSGNSWNYFDFAIVSVSVLEEALQEGVSLSHTRMVRLLRLTRLMKVFRAIRIVRIVRFLGALKTIINSLLGTMRQVIWTFVLIFGLMFFFSIVFGQIIGEARMVDPEIDSDEILMEYWSTIPRCMLTLYMSVTGGVSWDVPAKPLAALGADAFFAYLAYLAMIQWVVLNVVTGMFCESAAAAARKDLSLAVELHRAERDDFLQRCRAIFRCIDHDGDGVLKTCEMKERMDSEPARALFASMELDFEDVNALFALLDDDGDQTIDLEEFVLGCLRLRGGARAIDLARLLQETHNISLMMRLFLSGKRADDCRDSSRLTYVPAR
eukprot:TRINITY_DN45426_c0_g1_i4.p1 TRINITY_DN45426_c0_g1~~TRINITY_DN45426_c0_g1_i4.p1  ORF type:complete len:615 (+),score=93.40 TRINITY_DN45426_c0_g1_i4:95-1939(+)